MELHDFGYKWQYRQIKTVCCTIQPGCSGVGTAFPHLSALETLLEDLDFSFQFLHVAPGAA